MKSLLLIEEQANIESQLCTFSKTMVSDPFDTLTTSMWASSLKHK